MHYTTKSEKITFDHKSAFRLKHSFLEYDLALHF